MKKLVDHAIDIKVLIIRLWKTEKKLLDLSSYGGSIRCFLAERNSVINYKYRGIVINIKTTEYEYFFLLLLLS